MIPPKHIAEQINRSDSGQGIYLESSHLCMDGEIANSVFKEEMNAYLAFYPEKSYLLLAPVSHAYLKKMHDASQHMLKAKSLKGDKSIALHELLIDHEINVPDGPLKFEIKSKTQIIQVFFP